MSTPGVLPTLIIGAGISGLATAWFLHRRGVPVMVLEAGDQPGGTIATRHWQGHLLELGPNSTLQKSPGGPEDALGRLVAQVGLEQRLLPANPDAQRRYVLRRRQLQLLPMSPPALFRSGLFSWRAKLRLLMEPFIGRGRGEETIAHFVTRRLGKEFLDYVIEPFVSGVYAGDPAQLSVKAAVPKIQELEEEHGSLIRGAWARKRLGEGAGMPKGRLVSFDAGMQTLPWAIVQALPAETVTFGARVISLERQESNWRVLWERGNGERFEDLAPQVVVATPAYVAAELLQKLAPQAARSLGFIPYAPIVSLALGFDRAQVQHPLDGFGFLIPRQEDLHTLGALFSSTLFADRAPPGKVLLTAFIGGAMNPEVMVQEDDALIKLVKGELAQCLGIQGEPELALVTRHKNAIPQYTLGHHLRLQHIDKDLKSHPTLHLRANWRDGVSVADCVRGAERFVEELFSRPPVLEKKNAPPKRIVLEE